MHFGWINLMNLDSALNVFIKDIKYYKYINEFSYLWIIRLKYIIFEFESFDYLNSSKKSLVEKF